MDSNETAPDFKENTPESDVSQHARLASELAYAEGKVASSQDLVDGMNPVRKAIGGKYEKIWLTRASEKLDTAQRKFDEQLGRAATHIDGAHEQALGYVEMANEYESLSKRLESELGVDIPEKSPDDIIEQMRWESVPNRSGGSTNFEWATRKEDRAAILALREALTPFVDVDGKYMKQARQPREGLGISLDEAGKILEQDSGRKFLKVTSGKWDDDSRMFIHGAHESTFLPLSKETSELLEKLDPELLDCSVRYQGYRTERTNFDVVSTHEIEEEIKEKNAPVKAEVNYLARGRIGLDTIGMVSEMGFESEDEAKQKILELLLSQPGVSGAVTLNGKEMTLKEFFLGEPAEADQEAA